MLKKELEKELVNLARMQIALSKRITYLENDICDKEWNSPSERTKRATKSVITNLGKLIPTVTTRNIPKVKVRW